VTEARAAAGSISAAAGWIALAQARPGTTYHLAPLLVVLAWPLAARARTNPSRWRQGLRRALGGLLVAGAAAAALRLSGDLSGPVLLGGSTVVETGLVALVGAAIGLWLARPAPDPAAVDESDQ
jgi:hypothetical protein